MFLWAICGIFNLAKFAFCNAINALLHSILIITTHVLMHYTTRHCELMKYRNIRYYRFFFRRFSVFSVFSDCQILMWVSVSVCQTIRYRLSFSVYRAMTSSTYRRKWGVCLSHTLIVNVLARNNLVIEAVVYCEYKDISFELAALSSADLTLSRLGLVVKYFIYCL